MKVYEFKYKAINRLSQRQKGILLGTNHQEVENKLLQKGYKDIKIKRNFVIATQPKSEQITQFISQLSLLLNAKITLKQALNIVLETTTNIKFYQWLTQVIQLLETGHSFSNSLEILGKYFKPQEIQLIKIAEQSGQLSTIFYNIAKTKEKSEKLAKKVKKIIFYPVVVLIISIVLSILLLVFIVPQFAELYQAKDKTLPFITQLLFDSSHFLQQDKNRIISMSLLTFIIIFILKKKTTIIAKLKSKILSVTPIFKNIISDNRIIFFCQNIALMQKSGVPLNVALSSFISSKDNDFILQQEIVKIIESLNQGFSFSHSLNSALFGDEVIQMVSIGEQSGQLSQMLEHISEITQQRLDHKIEILSQMLEPTLMLVIGSIIGTIIMGLYLPIFDMGALV
ncbi:MULTISPECIES: type II secretion system F family protein [Pasteurellaceae]|uniref:Type II secretion system F family protein n=1 Tax=Pasteurella atlantica TaxID=2827233 RepID=A0AAW8CSN2_9PAST|nr:type II secretion system F family protein [Pasteurella atlantica]MBR0574520.1 type II secretion system F family protein [Pasteurella atlantica]MDP8040387.1 type II secretion system F family protein [Pasteurella atlantica]MDP8042563.1 type II secretion system F family protein [Pasteurella atlantica]MDP8044657.1 type II secretion system F family protein [Pasteurella atlantica]MDP8046714.1 type II secretion system F family protein [Pasteurella atlantica]